ncbi:hypothetical protein WME79_42420 [Sorangium sp. So ce726]|uniref:hypothetical protein n=1 Tax=Sorangium sp. So ce726 TaxID=3133319 RepID=UPI003F61E6E5
MLQTRLVEYLLASVIVMTATACDREKSSAERVEEYQRFVDERSSCTSTSECVLAGGGCPLGCGSGVRSEHAEAVNAKAKQLISAYEEGGQACKYRCPSQHVECRAGRCTAVPDP